MWVGKVFLKHQVNWNTVCGRIWELPWSNIYLSDNPVEVLNEHLSLLLGRYVPTYLTHWVCFLIFLRELLMLWPPRLSVEFRWLVRLGRFPVCWRQANVTPIPKSPPSCSVANHPPISITSVLSKVFEHLVSVRLDDLWNAVVCFQLPSLLIGEV